MILCSESWNHSPAAWVLAAVLLGLLLLFVKPRAAGAGADASAPTDNDTENDCFALATRQHFWIILWLSFLLSSLKLTHWSPIQLPGLISGLGIVSSAPL